MNKTKNEKEFKTKWFQFLIPYTLLNVRMIFQGKELILNMNKMTEELIQQDVYFDGSNFTLLFNLISYPLVTGLTFLNILFILIVNVIYVFIFKKIYISVCKLDESLYVINKYIIKTILGYFFIDIMFLIFYVKNIFEAIILFVTFIQIPILTYLFIYIDLNNKN